jgi:7-cyano-7-deazaguanine synthase
MASTGVLLSGGLDSAVLLCEEASRARTTPIYVSVGLAWEPAERALVRQYLDRVRPRFDVSPLVELSLDMRDIYAPTHWAIVGRPPAYHTPDEDVYLHGRNIVLLAKAGVYCATAGLDRLVLGTLDHNPFPDATPEFRRAMNLALTEGLNHALAIDAPYAKVSKTEVVRRGAALGLPLELTLSCMNPVVTGQGVRHCGVCSKCRERHDAFLAAGTGDPTDYADRQFVA